MTANTVDPAMPKWREHWMHVDGVTWLSPPPGFVPELNDVTWMVHPGKLSAELEDLTHACFGLVRPFQWWSMNAQMHDCSWVASHADNRVVISFTALGWGSAQAMRALRLVLVYATRDPERQHYQLAEAVIRANAKPDTEPTERERRALAEAICEAARELAKRLGWDAEGLAKLRLWTAAEVGAALGLPHPFKAEFNQAHHDVLFFDLDAATRAKVTPAQFTERLVQTRFGRRVDADTLDLAGSYQKVADLLDEWCKTGKLGDIGRGLAGIYRESDLYEKNGEGMFVRPSGPARVTNSPTLSPLFWAIGSAFWLDQVKPALERALKRAQQTRPAIARVAYTDELLALHLGEACLPGLERETIKDLRGRPVARIDAAVADLGLATKGLEAMRSPVGFKLIDTLVINAWKQQQASVSESNVITFYGGWSGLAAAIQYDPKDTTTLRALAEAGAGLKWLNRAGQTTGSGWWTYSEKRGGPGAPGYVRFVLGDPLRPGYALQLEEEAKHRREWRQLVPVLQHSPPLGDLNERSHGSAYGLSKLIILELVVNAQELFEHGSVEFTEEKRRALAKRAGLSIHNIDPVWEVFLAGDASAPPLLKDAGSNRVTLGDEHGLEREFIRAGGQRRLVGKKAGLRSSRMKAKRLEK